LLNFNKLDGNYSGITLGEYLDEYGIIDDESDFHNILTSEDFIYGAEAKTYDDSDFNMINRVDDNNVSIQHVTEIDCQTKLNLFEATNDSPYFEALAA